MSDTGFWEKATNFGRDAAYYAKAMTNVLPGQVWRKPGPALEDSILHAYGNSVKRGDGKSIQYPDWDGNEAGKRILGRAHIEADPERNVLRVNDVYDFYDGEVGEGYKQGYRERMKDAFKEGDVRYLAQSAGTELYKGKQALMPWANPRIEYEIPISKNSPAMNALNNTLSEQKAQEVTPRFHTVAPGENLTAIAQKYGTTPEDMARLNKLKNMNLIEPEQRLQY